MKKFTVWSAEDTDIARQMFVNQEPSEAFLAKLGRPETAARERIKRVDSRAKSDAKAAASKIPAKAFEDAVRRATAPRSLTQPCGGLTLMHSTTSLLDWILRSLKFED